ncbi:MAG: hypothetical protein J0I21_01840 [Alphaproteobacteria bacterium]|nr:hypothetical protein [Alphaproteobacteria bacterium]
MALRITFARRANQKFSELAELRPVVGAGNGRRRRSGHWRVLGGLSMSADANDIVREVEEVVAPGPPSAMKA